MAKRSEEDLLCAARNFVRIALHNITYVRGLFPDKCFFDMPVPELGLIVKKLVPVSNESRRLIDWIEKGLFDALQKKYLKTVLFCIWGEQKRIMLEEYTFSFSYPTPIDENVTIQLTWKGSSESIEFISIAADATTNKMRNIVCNMIRMVASHMITLDHKPEEQIILGKLLFNPDAPGDYEPPLISHSVDNDAINVCNPLNLEDEELNNNCVVFSLKIKDVLYSDDNCINDENESMSLDADLDKDYMLYDIEVVPLELSCYIVDSEGKNIIHYGSTTRKPVETIIDRDNDENHVHMKPGYLSCVSSRKVDFFLDSGAAHHICRDRFCLRNFKKLPKKDCVNLFSADGETFEAQHKGDLIYHNIKLHNVLFARKTGFNVISVAELDKQGLMTCIGGGQFSIYNVQISKVVAQGYLDQENNDYLFSAMDWCLPKEDINEMALVEGEQQQGAVVGNKGEEWVIDSLCARHMVPTRSMIPDMVPESLTFRTATGTIRVKGKGQVTNDNITLSDVLYSPDINHNLMSVAQLDKRGYLFTFGNGRCQIQIRETLEDIGYGILDYTRNWYILKDFKERTNSDQAPLEGRKRGKKRRHSK